MQSSSQKEPNADALEGAVETMQEHSIEEGEDDAICRRTRARYSLANFTLDELETFLQETDDEDDLPNVDDEEEYRKFLAAVLHDSDAGTDEAARDSNAGGGGDDDDDEENDADFEVEIEEALMDSDLEEGSRSRMRKEMGNQESSMPTLRRPETRQKKRQTCSSDQSRKRFLGPAKMPLRPLLPSVSNAIEWPRLLPETMMHCSPAMPQLDRVGFTAHQIGQLHCLIHEHVQLLVQVYTLCVFEPSRHHIASDTERMILELVCKRDEALAHRKNPYPGFCFRPPYIHPSVNEECGNSRSLVFSNGSDVQKDCSDINASSFTTLPAVSRQASPATHLDDENFRGEDGTHGQNNEDSMWVPVICGRVMSVLDVAPLSLVSRYITEVSTAMQEFSQCHVGAMCSASHFERVPLFPLPTITASETNSEVSRESVLMGVDVDPSHLAGHVQKQPKKSLAATLVESTKKQSVALVPKNIVNFAQRFLPLFNSALFPHKPPPPAVANRVLFTDAEDELLAMGLMEYNNDWKEIQQRFLPCKSKHQIFVRQKNRSSSKAPENPIKAVRRMKASPLTAEEKARIHEGLRVYKLDWMSIWKYFVPHRDPSLLPRQWRIALGTQKSYKTSEATKAKRRVYESMRRKSKKEVDNVDGDNSADGNVDDEDEAYVHEAFLADSTKSSKLMSPELPSSNVGISNLQSATLFRHDGNCTAESWVSGTDECRESSSMHDFIAASKFSGDLQRVSHVTHFQYSTFYTAAPNQRASNWNSKSSCSQVNLRPYRMRKSNISKLVKLAPDLPPVNLPPSVRVISQSAFKSYHCESSFSKTHNVGTENPVSRIPWVEKSGATPTNAGKSRNSVLQNGKSSCFQHSRTANQPTNEEMSVESDLQMHPLLFQAPEDGFLPYLSMNCSNSSSTFSFFPGTPLQPNLDLIRKSPQASGSVDCFHPALRSKEVASNPCTIDFHPLLQRADNIDSDLEPRQGSGVQLPVPSNSFLGVQMVSGGQWTSNTTNASPCEKSNELDLDIHLSSAASRERVAGSRCGSENNTNELSTVAKDHGIIEERQQAKFPFYHNRGNCTAAASTSDSYAHALSNAITADSRSRVGDNAHATDAGALALSSDYINRFTEDNLDEESNPGIVMEQEELSDSDEVGEEDVEFECEEMADSEGEGLDCERLANIRRKELPNVAMEEGITSKKKLGIVSKLGACGPRSSIFVDKSNARPRKSVSTEKGKNVKNSIQSPSPCLGLSCSKLKRERGRGNQDSSNEVQSRPSRLSKRKSNLEGIAHSQVSQHSSSPVECNTITSSKKPKKRSCRMSRKGIDACSSGYISNENMVYHRDNCGKVNDSKMPNAALLEPSLPNTKEQPDSRA